MKDHRNWCNKHNYGVSHFGLDPSLLNLTDNRYDILHLKLSITRKIITFIRFYLEKFTFDVRQKFIKILSSTWGSFYVDCYEANKNLNVIHSEQVSKFITILTLKVTEFLEDILDATNLNMHLIKLLNS